MDSIQKSTRRSFLKLSAGVAMFSGLPRALAQGTEGTTPVARPFPGDELVNDIHSQLNATHVDRVVRPDSVEKVAAVILEARSKGKAVSIAGGRHAMGGQQFAEGALLLDMRSMNRVRSFDRDRGLVDVEAGIEWPELIGFLSSNQEGDAKQWGIIQKQTGADRLSLGGALASNVHGRGLALKPIIDNIESFTLMDCSGTLRRCDRRQNSDLFRLAIGGYGLLGVITSIELRLRPRQKVQRVVEIRNLADIPSGFEQRINDGYLYGDFQFATDSGRESFLHRGVFSCYRPMPAETPLTVNPTRFHPEDWARLTYYTHKYKRRAFDFYTKRYLETSGQIYWSDSQLSAAYVDNYHQELDQKLHAKVKATEMITEVYVPRESLIAFMDDAQIALREQKANVIYGTVRLIEKDEESFLPWARDRYACVIFNLHVTHDEKGIRDAQLAFRTLIDLAIRRNGSYYLTYHRWATREQVERCYPQFQEFLRMKKHYDPDEIFQSDWYRHYKKMFA
jgi:FAD/FMN-containing dehydrogenase